ncbi:MAG TPA: HYR domain-containing protein [Thermoanaerobaculia bacterium]|nr:HYR domain-containing protein [Thermoanaerobaculia bacterium]
MIAGADVISAVSPANFDFGLVEQFLTIRGTGLAGSVSTEVQFTGPNGTIVTAVSDVDPNGSSLIVWVPEIMLLAEGRVAVTVIATDATAIRTIGPAYFTVSEQPSFDPPQLALPEAVVAEADSIRGAIVEFPSDISAVDPSNGATLPVSCNRESGSLFQLGVTVVTCSATNSFGTTTGGFIVVVTDTVAPVVTVPDDITSDNPVVTFTASAVDNLDGSVPVTCRPASGSTFPAGDTQVVCIANDLHFNQGVGTFNVHITGGPPRVLVPGDIVAEATSAAGAAVTFDVTAEDADSVTCTPASGATFPIGTTLVVCTATNTAGSSTGSFNVTVQDTTGPVFTAPDITAEATSAAGAIVNFTVTAVDAVDGARPVTCTPVSGSQFPLGTTEVQCSATDTRNNGEVASFFVNVVDTTPPDITSLTVSPTTLWPPNHNMVTATVTASATDAVDPAPVLSILSVSSNQPDNGTGDGDVAPDWAITGPWTVDLRAERAGNSVRIYTITVQATDAAGNSSTASVMVTVSEPAKRRR